MVWRTPTASTKARGYDGKHVKARKAAARTHQDTDPCCRCKHPLGPMGAWLHYDHNDARDGYLGFSHGGKPCAVCGKRCNIRAGAQVAQRKSVRAKVYLLAPKGQGCPTCGRVLTAGQTYCSQRCGYIAHKNDPPKPKTPRKVKAKPEPKPCTMCGQPVAKGRQLYCCADCQLEHNARANRERYRAAQGLQPTWEKPRSTADRW